jgi:hypothetical protein
VLDIHMEWQVNPLDTQKLLKYYRVYRNDTFIGVVRITRFVDKEASVKAEGLLYRVEAISLKNEVIATLEINPLD